MLAASRLRIDPYIRLPSGLFTASSSACLWFRSYLFPHPCLPFLSQLFCAPFSLGCAAKPHDWSLGRSCTSTAFTPSLESTRFRLCLDSVLLFARLARVSTPQPAFRSQESFLGVQIFKTFELGFWNARTARSRRLMHEQIGVDTAEKTSF